MHRVARNPAAGARGPAGGVQALPNTCSPPINIVQCSLWRVVCFPSLYRLLIVVSYGVAAVVSLHCCWRVFFLPVGAGSAD